MAQAIALLEPVAEALSLAHTRGIAHRDVKPGNVMIMGDARADGCQIKLLDFGIAKVVQDAQKMAGAFSQTSGQVTSFTPAYGAPEQFSRTHGSTGPWTDVFALALMFSELVSGKDPLVGDDIAQLGFASMDPSRRPTPRTLGAPVTDAVEEVCSRRRSRCRPDERYARRASSGTRSARRWGCRRCAPSPGRRRHEAGAAGRRCVRVAKSRAAAASVGARRRRRWFGRRTGRRTMSQSGGAATSGRVGRGRARSSKGAALAPASAVVGLVVRCRAAPSLRRVAGVATSRARGTPRRSRRPPPAASAAPRASAAAPAAKAPTGPEGMVSIPGGKFFMGSDDKADLDFERPAHQVMLAPFCIDKFEVTVDRYKACSDKGECKRAGTVNDWEGITEADKKSFDPLCNARDPDANAKHPINCVDWDMADAFCKAAAPHGRLPTEAEWEFAARGPDGRKFPWGDEWPDAKYLNACDKECLAWGQKNKVEETAMYKDDDGFANTAPVGSFPAGKSRYGVQDVVGNVWEWTSDWYAPYTPTAAVDPKGPEHEVSGDGRVIRGGAWNGAYPAWVRPTFRYHDAPTKKSYGIGFRCAADLE